MYLYILSIKKNRGTIAHNPEYFEDGHPDDEYAVIHDHHVTSDSNMVRIRKVKQSFFLLNILLRVRQVNSWPWKGDKS